MPARLLLRVPVAVDQIRPSARGTPDRRSYRVICPPVPPPPVDRPVSVEVEPVSTLAWPCVSRAPVVGFARRGFERRLLHGRTRRRLGLRRRLHHLGRLCGRRPHGLRAGSSGVGTACWTGRPPIDVMPPRDGPGAPPRLMIITLSGGSATVAEPVRQEHHDRHAAPRARRRRCTSMRWPCASRLAGVRASIAAETMVCRHRRSRREAATRCPTFSTPPSFSDPSLPSSAASSPGRRCAGTPACPAALQSI